MSLKSYAWEAELLEQAQFAAQEAASQAWRTVETVFAPYANPGLLDRAYRSCERLTAFHSRTFHLASGLLPAAKRRAARALYAFCRTSDDLVDRAHSGQAALEAWSRRALNPQWISEKSAWEDTEALTILAWTDARHRFQVPPLYAQQLIEGVAADLGRVRYETFDELAQYCYRVASTVGLMSMHITGFTSPEAIPYAIRLGVALQLTNILRDVGEDWRNGRLYLPQQELAAFGLSEDHLAAEKPDSRWREFMRFQIARARRLYEEAWPGIRMLNRDGRFAIAAAARLYQAILEDIEAHDYDNFHRRAYVSTSGKLRRLLPLWWSM
ncbi:MAG: phytoene/squalene synthase family protein [Chloroflexota bacterium]